MGGMVGGWVVNLQAVGELGVKFVDCLVGG